MARKYLLIIGCVLGLFTSKTYSQATTILYIDSVNILSPALFGDTVDIGVQVRVNGFLGDTIIGDIFYYFQSDTMDSLGIPPQIINTDTASEIVIDPFWDTIPIPINPGEMKTGPLNLIVVWPAMISPEVLDTDSIVFELPITGYLGIEPPVIKPYENILYPSPAMHYLFIKPQEIDLISEIRIMNMQGQMVNIIQKENFQNGWINIDTLTPGFYMVMMWHKDGTTISKKILKQ